MSDQDLLQHHSSLCEKSNKNNSSETTADLCVICKNEDGSKTSKLTAKGCQGLSMSSSLRGDGLTFSPGQIVHTECRRLYCHPNQNRSITTKADDTIVLSPKTRRSTQDFNFQLNCLFCGSTANINNLKRSSDTFPVRTLEFQDTVKSICQSRKDEWGDTVMGRLEYAQDLPAIEARYHQTCSSNFRTGCQIPLQFQSKSPSDNKYKKGRPTKTVSEEAFLEVIRYFQSNEVNQITVKDLVLKMTELCGDEAYSGTYMKKKLVEHFGSSIVISELDGKHNVVFFKTAADSILYSFHQRSEKDNTQSEKNAVIKTAAKLILNDIKLTDCPNDVYPTSDDMINNEQNLQYVPDSLQSFLNTLLNQKQSNRKVASIGQAIVQLSMPRKIIAPLQLGLGVQMHHQFGSKFLIETLNGLGFSVSYPEVLRYEACAASTRGTVLETSDQFVQYVADNVDHNTGTIDGHNTFHGMGIIATVTPKVNNKIIVPRTRATSDDLIAIGKINIHFYKKNNDSMEEMVFKKLIESSNVDHVSEGLEFLIKVARPLRIKTPGWSGLMQMVQTGNYPGVSSVVFMPMIDLNPSDMSCIYSTLHFVAKQSRENSTHPIVTFDQPLYWKALNIVANEPASSDIKSVLLRLGGFHTEMSFLGCLGRFMENSGLRESLETVYAPNTVDHMLSGKAVARATRGHFLVDDALNTLFVEKMYPHLQDVSNNDENNNCLEEIDNTQIETESNVDETTAINDLFNKVLTKQVLPENIYDNITLQIVRQKYEDKIESISENRTARLWLQYMSMVDILKRFIKAERTGNWKMHLKSMQEMLPYFAAAGHNLYLKSGYVYLQQMTQLDTEHPALYDAFCNGHHVIRRSDRYWAGLSSDLVIEQVLMRSVKSVGGLTRGRGMSETQRAQWLLSMPACADINNAMQEFTGHRFETSDQHKESQNARLIRDEKDRQTIAEFLRERNPFTDETVLRNIETGAAADKNVNVDNAKHIGENILKAMEDKNIVSYGFKRCWQTITLGSKNSVRINDDEVQVDPQLLFQRLIFVSDQSVENTEEIFSYEMCGHPSSLFDASGLLREAQKPQLANAIAEQGDCDVNNISEENIHYVLDGGSLLHRIQWTYGSTFMSICEDYEHLVARNYGLPTVVFDGYINGPSTKNVTHQRRTKGISGAETKFTSQTPIKTKKELFLSNNLNKQRFIDMLGQHLSSKGCHVLNADDDADVLIARTAVQKAVNTPVVVVGEDTDLLVLLCHYPNNSGNDIYFTSDSKSGTKRKKIWDINKTKATLGSEVCSILPLIHGLTGCDTVSRIYGIGKGPVLKKFVSDQQLRIKASTFMVDSSHEDVANAGETILALINGGSTDQGLDNLRYRKFIKKMTTSTTVVQVQTLPPTKVAARFHSFRAYLQVQTWIGHQLNPLEWGWCMKNNKLVPVKTTLPAAPEGLLKIIRCSCKVNCDSKRCSCRKHGLHCTSSCGDCQGTGCSNVQTYNEDID